MFKGSLPAMVTPFNNGEVDVKGLRKLVNWHIEQAVRARARWYNR